MNRDAIIQMLREYESRNVLFTDPDGSWPIIWDRAQGTHVWDSEGKKYLDLTAAFGVAAAGHANPNVVRAGQEQMATLLHAMGDVHPHRRKAELARELSRITFERWTSNLEAPKKKVETAKTIFCNSGFEAVEAALKTAALATGRHGVIAFHGAYHGLGYGALNATHREFFRGPFRMQLKEFASFVPFPVRASDVSSVEALMQRVFRRGWVGAVLVEPVQARGGINVPPPQFLPMLRRTCDAHKALLVADEIYTGFGRTGKWFACEHTRTVPDLVCLGKALTGGFPLSACVGRADVMDAAWPSSRGEAIHTSTFLGHPVGCAMALAQIAEIEERKLPDRAAKLGGFLRDELKEKSNHASLRLEVRGIGLIAGIEVRHAEGQPAGDVVFKIVKAMLQRGFILLPEGEQGNVISFTPPLTITRAQLTESVAAMNEYISASIPNRRCALRAAHTAA